MQEMVLMTVETWPTELTPMEEEHDVHGIAAYLDMLFETVDGPRLSSHDNMIYMFDDGNDEPLDDQARLADNYWSMLHVLAMYLTASGYLWRGLLTRGSIQIPPSMDGPPQGSAAEEANHMLPHMPVIGLCATPGIPELSSTNEYSADETVADLPEGWRLLDLFPKWRQLEDCLARDQSPESFAPDNQFWWQHLYDALMVLCLILKSSTGGYQLHGCHRQTLAMLQQHYPILYEQLGTTDPNPARISPVLDIRPYMDACFPDAVLIRWL